MYIEEQLSKLHEALTDFRVEMADRLARVENQAEIQTAQLLKINGSVAKSADRLNLLESADRVNGGRLGYTEKLVEENKVAISKLELDWTYAKGKVAGISIAISAICYAAFSIIRYYWIR